MRQIIHIDMDAFYASVEQRDDPRLRGRPLVVGGAPASRGVVAAASYEAREFGIRSAMPSSQAQRLCAHAVFVAPDFERYREVSRRVQAIFRRYTDVVEPLSLDEAYLDVTSERADAPYATAVARDIRAAIRGELELTASAGVAPNKFLAKIASDVNKPDGICVVTPDRIEDFLRALPVERLPGVGPRTAERLHALDVRLVPDLLEIGEAKLVERFGKMGSWLVRLAHGEDDRPVQARQGRKSISIEDTFEDDIVSRQEIERRLVSLAEGLAGRMRKAEASGRTVTLKVKYHDFRQSTRSRTLPLAVDSADEILPVVLALVEDTDLGSVPARLLGIGVSHLDDDDQVGEQQRQMYLPFPDLGRIKRRR